MKRLKWLKLLSDELASLNVTFILLALLIFLLGAGAWIPQSNTTSQTEMLQRFGTDGTKLLIDSGLHDVFHSTLFLTVVAFLFINLVACTLVTMAPRIRAKVQAKDFADQDQINDLKTNYSFPLTNKCSAENLKEFLEKRGFQVRTNSNQLVAEKGRLGWLAAPVTHLGLFVLLGGVIFSSLTGYSGRIYLTPDSSVNIAKVQKKKPIIGSVEDVRVALKSTSRVDYKNGKPKQWFSELKFFQGDDLKKQATISVNNPTNYSQIEFFQSDWSISSVNLTLADQKVSIPLKEMGGDYMGVFPLLPELLLIVSVPDSKGPLKLYIKPDAAKKPKFLSKLKNGEEYNLGKLKIKYIDTTVRTGIEYKYDPGQYIVYFAFILFFVGAIFVATPAMKICVCISDDGEKLIIGSPTTKFVNLVRVEILKLKDKIDLGDSSEVAKVES